MRRCPKCNRTFETDTQKFCTHDGGLLFAIDSGLSETVQLDSTKIRDAVAKPTTRDLDAKLPAQFDPEATVIAPAGDPEATMISAGRDDATVQGRVRDTGELAPQVTQHHITPPAVGTSGPIPPTPAPPPSGPITPPHTSAPLPPTPAPPPSGPITPPYTSAPLPPTPAPPSGPITPPYTSGPLTPAQPAATGPVGTSAPLPAHQVAPQPPSQPLAAPPKKKSKLPLILGILAVLVVLGLGVVVAAYLLLVKFSNRPASPIVTSEPGRANPAPSLATAPATDAPKPAENEPAPYVPPPDAVQFVNSKESVTGKLVENFVDFSFYYPDRWVKVPSNDNFIKVERRLPPDFTQENFAAAPWYAPAATIADNAFFHTLAEKDDLDFSKKFPEYRKISEGPTKVGIYDAYEFRFEAVSRGTDKGDVTIWGREIFFPPRPGEKTGLKFLILTTSLAPELKNAEDAGQKGELPMLLESFRFGKK